MKLHHHTAFSAAISGVLYLIFKSWGMAVSCFISGIFIDLDHIIDVLREHGLPFKVKKFFEVCDKGQFDRVMLLWHGWEWIVLWGIAAWLTEWNPWVTGAFIGIGQHMILDTLYNSSNPCTYSLLWRWKKDFDFDTVFADFKKNKYKHRKDFSEEINK